MATCFYCGVETFRPTVDHVIPKHWGGPNARWNTVQSCSDCNNRKANTSYEYFTGNDLLPIECRILSGYATTYQFIMENCPDKWPKLQATEARMTQVLGRRELQKTEFERRKAARAKKRKARKAYRDAISEHEYLHGYKKGSKGSYDTDPQVVFERWMRGGAVESLRWGGQSDSPSLWPPQSWGGPVKLNLQEELDQMDSIKSVKRAAHAYVEDLDRPGRMSRTEWLRVKALLHAIVNYLPTPYPGQPRLARDTEMSQRSVRRYVSLAQEYNLLEVRPDVGVFRSTHNPSRTNYYHIIGLEHVIPSLERLLLVDEAKLAPSDEAKLAPKEDSDTYVSTSSTYRTENPSGSPQKGAASAAPRTRRLTVPKRNLSEALAKAEARGKRPVRSKRQEWDPSRRLMNHFLDVCTELDVPPDVRHCEGVGQVTGYIRATFIEPPAGRRYTPDEVEAIIARWAADFRKGRINLKPGQSLFQSFAGNWGHSTAPATAAPHSGTSFRERYKQQRREVDDR